MNLGPLPVDRCVMGLETNSSPGDGIPKPEWKRSNQNSLGNEIEIMQAPIDLHGTTAASLGIKISIVAFVKRRISHISSATGTWKRGCRTRAIPRRVHCRSVATWSLGLIRMTISSIVAGGCSKSTHATMGRVRGLSV